MLYPESSHSDRAVFCDRVRVVVYDRARFGSLRAKDSYVTKTNKCL